MTCLNLCLCIVSGWFFEKNNTLTLFLYCIRIVLCHEEPLNLLFVYCIWVILRDEQHVKLCICSRRIAFPFVLNNILIIASVSFLNIFFYGGSVRVTESLVFCVVFCGSLYVFAFFVLSVIVLSVLL